VVAGRVFAFADSEIIELAKTKFIPACADDWYQRRRTDATGEFWKKVYKQGPRKAEAGTHQGIYVFTADGELLAFKNAGQDVKATREQLAFGLRKWDNLPEARRKPGGVTIEDHGKPDANYSRTPPEGGLIVGVHARILDQKDGDYVKAPCEFVGGDRASRDFLWINADEVKQLVPQETKVSHTFDVPAKVAERIVRFHLVDNTRGEPPLWKREEIRSQTMKLTVSSVTDDSVELKLTGSVVLASEADVMKSERGYEPQLVGKLRYRPAKKTFDEFEIAALGHHWGAGTFTRVGVRPGKGLLGIAFGLVDPTVSANRVSPQGNREMGSYWGKY
jgi:hypothetical protein